MTGSAEHAARRTQVRRVLDVLELALEQSSGTLETALVQSLTPIARSEIARVRQELCKIGSPDDDGWKELAALSEKVRRIADETLAFVGGLAARTAGLDRETCVLADELISAFATALQVGAQPVTLPSAGEYIDVLSEVIRVRFPGRGLWDLPIVLHEFGHLLAARFRSTRPGPVPSDIFAGERERKHYRGTFAEEYWADTFATYAGGPAYAFAALSRFEPARASFDQGVTHPAAVKRASAIFQTLEALQATWEKSDSSGGTLRPAIDRARDSWHAVLASAGVDPALEVEDLQLVGGLTTSFIAILEREHPGVRYANASRAAQVRRFLAGQGAQPDDCSLLDVLNGAWWLRSTMAPDVAFEQLTDIADAARSLHLNQLQDA